MLKRKAYNRLLEWKGRNHKCLLVKGQRQVGKTYIIDHFARENYDNVVRFDLSTDTDVHAAFKGNLDVDSIIKVMALYCDPYLFVPGRTLIFLDEIQECPRARTALKQFSIDGRYDVIASGSMLGVDIPRDGDGPEPMVPVGYEEHMTMYSLDFEEFLWANNIPDSVIDEVRSCIRDRTPVDEAVLSRFDSLFRDFMIVGGMPAAVQAFVDTKGYGMPSSVLDSILESCRRDINRYNVGVDRIKVLECFESIPSQLSQSNKKFMYSRIVGEGSRKSAEKYMSNLSWINGAGYGNFCRMLDSMEPPLKARVRYDQFKVYMSDTGMLMHMYGAVAARAIHSGDTSYNMGAVAENIVAECIVKCGYIPYMYRKNGGEDMMELDFVTEVGTDLVVLEVKSGKKRTAPSLGKASRFPYVDRRVILAHSNISVDSTGVETYPLFAAAFLDEMEPDDGWMHV